MKHTINNRFINQSLKIWCKEQRTVLKKQVNQKHLMFHKSCTNYLRSISCFIFSNCWVRVTVSIIFGFLIILQSNFQNSKQKFLPLKSVLLQGEKLMCFSYREILAHAFIFSPSLTAGEFKSEQIPMIQTIFFIQNFVWTNSRRSETIC